MNLKSVLSQRRLTRIFQPSLSGLVNDFSTPGVQTPGYFQKSLRDNQAFHNLLRPPNIFHMRDAFQGFLRRHHGAEFKHFQMTRFHAALKPREINRARSRRAMVATRKLHVVNMKPIQPVALRFQMKRVIYEPQVLLDLRVAQIMPIDRRRACQHFEK